MERFGHFTGMLIRISDLWTENKQSAGCYKLMSVIDKNGNIVNFVVTPTTYFIGHVMVAEGDVITGFYDATAPIPLIYPPQYRALVISKLMCGINVKVDYFDEQLISSDGILKLNIAPSTRIILENDQAFTQNPANHNLIVIYGPTTRSIPAQTTPYKVIVMCPKT